MGHIFDNSGDCSDCSLNPMSFRRLSLVNSLLGYVLRYSLRHYLRKAPLRLVTARSYLLPLPIRYPLRLHTLPTCGPTHALYTPIPTAIPTDHRQVTRLQKVTALLPFTSYIVPTKILP